MNKYRKQAQENRRKAHEGGKMRAGFNSKGEPAGHVTFIFQELQHVKLVEIHNKAGLMAQYSHLHDTSIMVISAFQRSDITRRVRQAHYKLMDWRPEMTVEDTKAAAMQWLNDAKWQFGPDGGNFLTGHPTAELLEITDYYDLEDAAERRKFRNDGTALLMAVREKYRLTKTQQ